MELRPIQYRSDDIVLGGDAHREAFHNAISRARHRLIVHSTFISIERGMEAIELLRTPVQRGAYVDILWGQSSNKEGVNDTRQAAIAMRAQLERQGLSDRVRVHLTSTRSHAKILLSDVGDPSKFTAIIGSCNWLSSGFTSFEASVRLKDGGIVADVAFQLAELARPRDGQIPDPSAELVRLGLQLEGRSESPSRGSARLILGAEHALALLDARDNASKRIVILSHRLGVNARPVLKPLLAAALKNGVRGEAYYGHLTGMVRPTEAVDEILRAREDGLEMKAVQRPRLHAKLLAWDDDDVVITSQNWLSADPGDVEPRQEIGIQIKAPGVARTIIERFRIAHDFA